jgi:hypothetical protein
MATFVNYTKLFSEARNNVVDLITSKIDDPATGSAESRKFIYSRRPDVKSNDFAGYPYIIVNPSDITLSETGSVDGKTKMATWTIEIEVVSSDRAYGDKDGQGLVHMDNISDQIISIFADQTNKHTLRNNGIAFATPTSTPVSNEVIHSELVYERSFIYTFQSRKRVSA